MQMLHSSSSCGACYKKLLLGMPCSCCRLKNIMPTFEVGSRKHIKKTSAGYVLRTMLCAYVRLQRKGARVRPTSRAYGDADPCLVCPTATAATAAAAVVVVREAHFCCGCRTSVQVKLLWLLLRKISSFCWTKHVICRFFVLKLLLLLYYYACHPTVCSVVLMNDCNRK